MSEKPSSNENLKEESHEPRGVLPHIADADKKARAGTVDEKVRNTPPAGKWNETSSD